MEGKRSMNRLTEGKVKKGGINSPPTTPKPCIRPGADKPKNSGIRSSCMCCKPADMPCQLSKECKREKRERNDRA
jgi:hypothetical protein